MRKNVFILLVMMTCCHFAFGQIAGKVFRDFNSDGTLGNNEVWGYENVKVYLYASNGQLLDSAITDQIGAYSFPGITAASGKVKVQFLRSSFPSSTQESFSGSQNGTDIQFVTAPSLSVNLALKSAGDYCGQNPKIVTPIFIDGASGTNTTGLNEALYSLNYSNYGAKTTEATRAETGATWGVAYSKKAKQLFSAAFLKRHVGLKDGKLGQIYVTDMGSVGTPTTPWLDVSTLGLSGNWQFSLDAARGLGNAGTPSKDSVAFSQIAATGLGDIEISEDESQLYAMDLINKQLLVIDIATKTLVGAYPVPDVCSGNATPSYYCAYPKTFTATDGKVWKNGYYFNTDNGGGGYNQTITNANNATAGTTDAALYSQSIYAGSALNYQFPLVNGTYTVKLHMASNGFSNNTNFNVTSENVAVFSNLNIFAEAGNVINTAVVKSYTATVTDGILDIRLSSNAGNPNVLISGFEIIPTSGQSSGQTRPFAIKPYKGKVYVGAVCDASGSQDMSDLNGGIFEFNPQTNTFNNTPILSVPLNYVKGPEVISGTISPLRWFPWTSVYPNNTTSGISIANGFDVYNQPVLSDIEFDLDGSMILGFFDRFGHQMGSATNLKPNGQTSNPGAVGGDLLRAYYNGSSYELENNAKEGTSSTKSPTAGANNNQGPGGGEFYFGDNLGGNANGAGGATGHYEILMGGLAFLPGSGEIRATAGDALVFSSGALASFNNMTGGKQNSFTMYTGTAGGVQLKSNGLGDLELLCELPPIQIGNFVWLDVNHDGIQDANESAIPNVVVTLWKGNTQIASTTTNAKGEYYFSENSVSGVTWTGTGADTTLLPFTNYEVKIDLGAFPNYQLSIANANGNTIDQMDNDASLVGTLATIAFATGDVGSVNHTYDIGLTCTGGIQISSLCTSATCPAIGITANNNASLQITSNGDRVAISTTSIPTTLYSAANQLISGAYTFISQNGQVDSFWVRVWDGPVCYRDTLIVVNPIRCCPTINAITIPATNALYCSSSVIPAFNVTTNAVATDSIRIVSFTSPQTDPAYIYANGTFVAQKVITGNATSVSNTANFTNLPLPNWTGAQNDTLWLYALYIDKLGDTSCKVIASKSVIIKPEPIASIQGFAHVCNGDNVTLSSQTATSYKWGKMPSATTLVTTQTYTPTPTVNSTNTYWLVTTNAGTCASDTAYFSVTASQGIQGTVYRDFNSDGVINANETVGFKNIKVRLFDNSGVFIDSTLTDIYGRYVFPNATAGMGKLRIEFDKSTYPAYTQESFSGANNGTDVQFVTAPNCSINLGLKETRDFCGINPKIVTPIFIDGASATNTTGLNEALYSLNYSNYGAKTTEATRAEIGSAWGVAYAKKTKQLFTAAFLKRHVGLKDGKLGQIFVTDMTTAGSPTTPWLDVSTLGLAGNWQFALDASRGLGNAGTPSRDSLAFSEVAATGLGDIDISEDESQLYAMDLINKQLLVIDIATKALVGAYPVPSICNGNATPSYYAANAQTFTATDGKLWKNGYYFNTDNSGLGYVQNITNPNNVVAGTSDLALYATSVYNTALNYQFPLGNGTYSVKLHLATNGLPNNTNFNVISEGVTAFSNVNVYAEAGNAINKAVTKTFTTTVSDGILDIKFVGNAGTYVLISGFEITPTSGQASGQTRPFAIKPYKGKVYVGAVCDASTSQDMSDLNGGVFEFNPQTATFNSTPVLTIPLNYAKGALVAPSNDPKRWFPWTNVYPNNTPSGISTGAGGFDIYNQPVLSDIEFDLDGSMILGFFDRMGHQMAANVNNYKPNGQLSGYAAVAGDLLRAYFNGTNFELEHNGKEGVSSTKSPSAGANNNQGPGGGEFYFGDNTGGDASGGGNALGHYEILMGGLAFLPGSGEVRATAGDPLVFSSGGFSGFNNTTGNKQNGFTLYTSTTSGVQLKSSGLGDLEILCDQAPIQIGNYVWFDANKDGIQDPNESPLSNIVVTLWKGNTQIASTTTNSKGEYYFSENSVSGVTWIGTGADTSLLPNAAYEIRIDKSVQPSIDTLLLTLQNSAINAANDQNDNDAALIGSSAIIQLVTGEVGSVNHSYDFGFAPPPSFGSIGNFVWNDLNANGIQDEAAAEGINGVMVYLFNKLNPSTPIDSILTSHYLGNPGYYLFDSLASGEYIVQFPLSVAHGLLSIQNASLQTDLNSDASQMNGQSPVVVINADGIGQDKDNTTIDAGYYVPAQLGNYVWNDIDQDGLQDATEVGVAGITVTLFDNANQVLGTTITDAYGYYKFEQLKPDTFHVGFTLPANYLFTSTNSTSDSLDNDVNPLTGMTGNYILAAGDSNMTVDAGIYFVQPTTASVGNYVWYDTDQDGVQDLGEQGLSGVTVTLYNSLGEAVATMLTDANGYYQFTEVVPGDYTVGFTPPVGLAFSPNSGGISNPSNSDVNPLTGFTGTFTVNSGDKITYVDAGLFSLPSNVGALGDRVWFDLNQDGIQDPNEPGVGGVLVTLYESDGVTIINTTTTDAFGNYIFNNLQEGQYVVGFDNLPIGYDFTTTTGADSTTNSNANAGTGKTNLITLSQGQFNLTIDAGIINTIPTNSNSLGNYVWYDVDKDGIQDSTEVGVSGVTVTLYDVNNLILETSSTDQNGFYLFPNLPNGDYYVGFSNIPSGFVFSSTGQGSNSTDSDAEPATGKTSIVSLTGNTHNMTLDAGINEGNIRIGKATVGDRVWYDVNNNGLQDVEELGVQGVTVTLYQADGITVIASTETNALGYYIFTGLDAGGYIVGFGDLPNNYTISQQDADAEGIYGELNSDVNPNSLKSNLIQLGTGDDIMSIDMGIVPPSGTASLGNFVWFDLNHDGLQSNEEPGVQGVSVTLYDSTHKPIATTTTNSNGKYSFVGLTPGSYSVGFANLPSGYELTIEDANSTGIDGSSNSDANPTTGFTSSVTLVAGDNNLNLDAGIVSSTVASVGDYVWFDTDRDGLQDANEAGVGGVLVTLYDISNTPVASTITNPDGSYIFTNVIPGDYTIAFTNIPSELEFTIQEANTSSSDGSNANSQTGVTPVFTVLPGTHNPTIDAGVTTKPNAGLGNYVWHDVNENGLQDSSEPGVPGVLVTLYDDSGAQILATAVTDGNGAYSFTNLEAGSYIVGFSNLPIGSTRTQVVGTLNEAANSDMLLSGKTHSITLGENEYNPNIDAGIYFGVPLSADLASISVVNANCDVVLNWITKSENNVSHFVVFRTSLENNVVEKLAQVKAKGTSSKEELYSYTDQNVTSGSYTYQIEMVDVDGQRKLSDKVAAKVQCGQSIDHVIVFPNPTMGQLNVRIQSSQSDDFTIQVRDVAGRIILQTNAEVNAAVSTSKTTTLSLNSLANGTYTVYVFGLYQQETFKVQLSK